MVQTLRFPCKGHRFDPWWGNLNPTCHTAKKIAKERSYSIQNKRDHRLVLIHADVGNYKLSRTSTHSTGFRELTAFALTYKPSIACLT